MSLETCTEHDDTIVVYEHNAYNRYLTEAEKQRMIERAAQELAYKAAADTRAIVKAAERKSRRIRRMLSNTVCGGCRTPAPNLRTEVVYGDRGERRRVKLGRA